MNSKKAKALRRLINSHPDDAKNYGMMKRAQIVCTSPTFRAYKAMKKSYKNITKMEKSNVN